MRKLGTVVLSVPVMAAVYFGTLVRTPLPVRLAALTAIAVVLGLGALPAAPPPAGVAVPASTPRAVLSGDIRAVGVNHDALAPVSIDFSAPMDAASVAAALRITPPTAVHLAWDESGRVLTILPVGHWQPSTIYAVSVGREAMDLAGDRLRAPMRAVFLAEPAGRTRIEATRYIGERLALDAAFALTVDRRVDVGAVRRALVIEPAVEGSLTVLPGFDGASRFQFTPAGPLDPDTRYRVLLGALVDRDGLPVEAAPALAVRTPARPEIVRFRPADGAKGVERNSAVSVRFSEPMDRAATEAAFRVLAKGTATAGTITWAEGDMVLVFEPETALPWDAAVRVEISAAARSAAGVGLEAGGAAFRVIPRPAPTPRPVSSGGSGGGSVASGNWAAVEHYYLGLMNCTRTGGLVTSTGACSSPGGRNVAPLKLDAGITSKVARPYAKLLATRNLCSHFIGGNPGDRLRAAGYTSYRWAENLGCRSGDPYAAVLGSHLYFQSERSWSPPGGHYVNLMNSAYDRVGIGVWVSSGRVRLVVDFYHP